MNTKNQPGRLTLVPLVSRGWDVFRQNLNSMLPFALIYLPFLLVVNHMYAGYSHINELKTIDALSGMYFNLLIFFVLIILSVLPNMAIIKMVESSELGTPENWQGALRHAVSRWGASILTMLLLMLIMFGLALLSVVPGIIIGISSFTLANTLLSSRLLLILAVYGMMLLLALPAYIWMIYYIFAIAVVSLRRLSGKDALDYSKRLVKGQWWRVFGYVMALIVGSLIVQIPVKVIVALLPLPPLAALIEAAFQSVFTLFGTTIFTLFFLNLEAMKVGNDGASVTLEP